MTLEISNLKKSFGGVKALDGVSLKINDGITALIGPNGSGKSTLFHAISNLIKKDSGKILLNGEDITNLPDYEIAKKGISRTFQEVRLFENLTVKQHLEIALETKDESILSSFKKSQNHEYKIKEILELVGFKKPISTLATDLSYGQKKLLDLAIALAKPHKILLLDEPVAGINPKLRIQIKEILRNLRTKGEKIFIIEHDMNFIMDLADKVIVMESGKVLKEGTPEEIQNSKEVLEAYLG